MTTKPNENQPARFACFTPEEISKILLLDSLIVKGDPREIMKAHYAGANTFKLDENGEIWPTDEDKEIVTRPPSDWEPVPPTGYTDAGSYWQWDEPLLYTPKDKCRAQPRTLIVRCLGSIRNEVMGQLAEASLFLPIAIKNDRDFLHDISGRVLMRPDWFFGHGCCLNVRQIEKETEIMRSIRIAGQ